MKKFLLSALILIIFFGTIMFPDKPISGETDNNVSELDIGISPKDSLFNAENLKPGDWIPRTITVQNKGQKEFEYTASIQNNGKSVKLYNAFMLEVRDESGKELYNGKLAEFSQFSPRELESESTEQLEFTIKFPEESGNEYQGLEAGFILTFVAEGEGNDSDEISSSGVIGSGGSNGLRLPDTATDIFTFLLIGGSLVIAGAAIYVYQRFRKIDGKSI